MEHLLHVSDANANVMMVLSLDEKTAKKPAIDLVFEVLGGENPEELIERGILPEGQVEDFKAIHNLIFDRDDQGSFIRDGIDFQANGKELDPDKSMAGSFLPAQKEGVEYRRCNLVISGAGAVTKPDAISNEQQGSIEELSRLMFLHQIAMGAHIDVTKELAELSDVIAWAEKEGLIDIDVQKAGYKLTEKGKRRHASYIEEAQSLIHRYDIFGDVDIDQSTGQPHFDTGLGRDLRVAVYELEGIDPYRARFLLGLNDAEWDKMEDWPQLSHNENWYREIFAPVDSAIGIDDVGRENLIEIVNRGKAEIRKETQSS